jgi:alcohol dehydrogenase class IV
VADRDFSRFQKKVIQRYYDNRPALDEQRLAELATELYLAADKKKPKLWESAKELMERLGTPPSRVEHVIKTADPAQVAEVVKDIQSGKIRPKPAKKPETPAE